MATDEGPEGARDGRADAVTKVGVTAVVRDETGRILLGLKGRAFDPAFVDKWVTPGGRVGYGETLERAIIREVQEETGLIVSVRGAAWPQEIIHEKGHYVFFVFDAVPLHGTLCAGDDLSEVRWCDAADLSALREAMTPITRAAIDYADSALARRVRVLEGALRLVIEVHHDHVHKGDHYWSEDCPEPTCTKARMALAEPRDAPAPHNTEA